MCAKKRETLPAERGVQGIGTRGMVVGLRVVETGRDIDLPLALDDFAIGSDQTNHLVIDDRYVSGFHCSLERSKRTQRIIVRDRRSRNGTYVNGTRVHETEIDAGARIQIGSTTLALLGDDKRSRPAIELLNGQDPTFRKMVVMAMRAADGGSSVLITGESGTGKELVARLIHESSPRAEGPFVPVNCAAIPPELVETELFGHERGAFTGAVERRLGVFEQADGGTLFLDEIGDLPLNLQPRLLRVLETRRIRRVGGEGEREVNVRVVTATHKDLAQAARMSEFRFDLFHRLCGIEIRLPALRERPGDIPALLHAFLQDCAPGEDIIIDHATMEGILRYPWPGNIREFKNAVQRAVVLGAGRLELRHLIQGNERRPPTLMLPPRRALELVEPEPSVARETTAVFADPPVFMTVDQMMKALIERALTFYGSYRKAAAVLGMSKSTIHDKARIYGIALPPRAVDPRRLARRVMEAAANSRHPAALDGERRLAVGSTSPLGVQLPDDVPPPARLLPAGDARDLDDDAEAFDWDVKETVVAPPELRLRVDEIE